MIIKIYSARFFWLASVFKEQFSSNTQKHFKFRKYGLIFQGNFFCCCWNLVFYWLLITPLKNKPCSYIVYIIYSFCATKYIQLVNRLLSWSVFHYFNFWNILSFFHLILSVVFDMHLSIFLIHLMCCANSQLFCIVFVFKQYILNLVFTFTSPTDTRK